LEEDDLVTLITAANQLAGPAVPATRPEIHRENYEFLREYIHRESGIVLDGDKHYLLEARLTPVLHLRRLGSIDDLCVLLRATADAPLQQQVVEAMTTNETYFFRDPAHYDALKSVILPRLTGQRERTRKLSFWSAAASTGQEAYSLAMMLLEMGLNSQDVQVRGTDLSEQVLERARAGRYMQIEVNRGLPVGMLVKYFTRCGLEWQLNDEVRRMVEFVRFDLRQSMRTMGPFDIAFCRNVLIYFDLPTKKRVLNELRGCLYTGGYLLLGGSETTLGLSDHYEREAVGKAVLHRAV
jgi:chemotaxis protein methyltransferase CheR